MKRFFVCLLAACFIFSFCISAFAGDDGKKTSDKSFSDTARDVKTEAVNVYHESKDAVVRDFNSMKEDIPKGLKEAKDSAVQQSKDVMDGATKELKEMRENIANPKSKAKTDSK